MHYAIDFGTSNTVVARLTAEGKSETIGLPNLSVPNLAVPLVPSLVYVQNAQSQQVWVGQQVRERGLDVKTDRRFFQGFKRGIGQKIGYVPELDGEALDLGRVGNWFLQGVLQGLAAPESLVLTVPIDSYESYVQWLQSIAQTYAVDRIRILDEPTAAALGYGIAENKPRLLVIDFGGGTLDMVLMERQPPQQSVGWAVLLKWYDRTSQRSRLPQVKVLAKAGQTLGGMDIDQWILQYFHRKLGIPQNSLTLRFAERLKIQLSQEKTAEEVFFNPQTLTSQALRLDRDTLQTILAEQGFWQRLEHSLTQVQQQAKQNDIALADIDGVLLVGGTALMPAVQDWVARHFPTDRIRLEKPLEAIAHGALQDAQWQMSDILYHSYGIRYWDKRLKRQHWQPIIAAGQTYPLDQAVEVILGASQPEQSAIELVIGELGETATEVYFKEGLLVSRLLGEQRLSAVPLNDYQPTIANLDPPGQPGTDRIRVVLQVDSQRSLCITVEDLYSGKLLLQDQPVLRLI